MNSSERNMSLGEYGAEDLVTVNPTSDILNCTNILLNYTAQNFSSDRVGCENELEHSVGHSAIFLSPPWWTQILVQILYGIVCFVGLCGNTLVIYVVVRFSKMQTVTNLYIVNLAIADECFLVGIPFLMATASMGYWPFGKIGCKAYFTSTSINQITSSMFLLIMSADRYLAVCHPISAPKWRTPLIAKMVALTAWTLSALIMVPIFMYANTLEIDNKINCNIFWPTESRSMSGEAIFIIYSFFLGFAVPLILIAIFYVLVIRRLRTVGPKRRPPPPPSQPINISTAQKSPDPSNPQIQQPTNRSRDRKRSHRKVTKLVLTVITVYFMCWVLYWATQMALIFMPHDSNHSGAMLTMFLLAGCLSYSNSAMNPILYAFLSDNFKKSFLKACTCAKGKDVNAALHLENSVFPRGKRGSDRQRKPGSTAVSATSAGTTGTGMGTGGIAHNLRNINTSSSPHHLQVPLVVPRRESLDMEESNGESDDEAGDISFNTRLIPSSILDDPDSNAIGIISNLTQETFIQDGVHVTAL